MWKVGDINPVSVLGVDTFGRLSRMPLRCGPTISYFDGPLAYRPQ
jgi:hypothetical protein